MMDWLQNSSFLADDVTLLLCDVTGRVAERDAAAREYSVQAGQHYSEDLPIEHAPSAAYFKVFEQLLQTQMDTVALYTGTLTRLVLEHYDRPVFVSLVRAGVPCGVLMRRYAKHCLGQDIPHYGISIIRGKGFDENALRYILRTHPDRSVVFVDGWTGKGMITRELEAACAAFAKAGQGSIAPVLAVLADPAYSVDLYATRDDFLNPSCCLNSTVCGLISRTVHNKTLIGPHSFHGVRVYREFAEIDQTARYLELATARFAPLESEIKARVEALRTCDCTPDWRGMDAVRQIGEDFGVRDINRIKPSIGETTRVLLRRIPDRVLMRDEASPELAHIRLLAQEKGVPITIYPDMPYLCCGLITDTRGNAE